MFRYDKSRDSEPLTIVPGYWKGGRGWLAWLAWLALILGLMGVNFLLH